MVEVRKKDKENIGSLLRRLAEYTKRSGLLQNVKETQHRQKRKTRRQRRESALLRLKRQQEFKIKRRTIA